MLKALNVESIDEFKFVHGHSPRNSGTQSVAQMRAGIYAEQAARGCDIFAPLVPVIFAKLDPIPKISLYKIAHWNSPRRPSRGACEIIQGQAQSARQGLSSRQKKDRTVQRGAH
jgi:hypothetical protein